MTSFTRSGRHDTETATTKECREGLWFSNEDNGFQNKRRHYKAMNLVYATYFDERPPARAVFEAARIPRDALVEIMMVAQRP